MIIYKKGIDKTNLCVYYTPRTVVKKILCSSPTNTTKPRKKTKRLKTPFLVWLAAKIESAEVTDYVKSPVEEGEEVLGVMSEDLKILFTVYRHEVEELGRIHREHLLSHLQDSVPEDSCTAIHADLDVRSSRLSAIKAIFWQEVNEQFANGAELGNIGFREGFQIVKLSESAGNVFSSIEISVAGGLPPELKELFSAAGKPAGLEGLLKGLFTRRG